MSTIVHEMDISKVFHVAACEISFIPMEGGGGSAPVHRVIELVRESGLEFTVGAMSTLVRGDRDKVFELLEDIYVVMDGECGFVIVAKISNVCGCRAPDRTGEK